MLAERSAVDNLRDSLASEEDFHVMRNRRLKFNPMLGEKGFRNTAAFLPNYLKSLVCRNLRFASKKALKKEENLAEQDLGSIEIGKTLGNQIRKLSSWQAEKKNQ